MTWRIFGAMLPPKFARIYFQQCSFNCGLFWQFYKNNHITSPHPVLMHVYEYVRTLYIFTYSYTKARRPYTVVCRYAIYPGHCHQLVSREVKLPITCTTIPTVHIRAMNVIINEHPSIFPPFPFSAHLLGDLPSFIYPMD